MQVVIAFQGTMDTRDKLTNMAVFPSRNQSSAAKSTTGRAKTRGCCLGGIKNNALHQPGITGDGTQSRLPGNQHSGYKRSWLSVKDVVFLQVCTTMLAPTSLCLTT